MRIHRGIAALLALVLSAALAMAPGAAQEATPSDGTMASESPLAGLGFPEVTITTDGTAIDAPGELEAGRYRIVFENTGESFASLEVLQLPEDMTLESLEAAFTEVAESGVPPAIFYEVGLFNGGVSAGPGTTADVILDLGPGQVVVNLYTFDEATGEESTVPHPITVSGEMPADLTEPEGAIDVDMFEFDFQMPEPMPAGDAIWRVVNTGEQPHHIVVSQVPEGTTEEQVTATVAAFFGMPMASPEAGASPGPAAEPLNLEEVVDVFETPVLSPGVVNWISPNLEPGTYAAFCFLPTPEGVPHVMLGMIEVFTVGDGAATPEA